MSPDVRIPTAQTKRGYSLLPPPEADFVCVWGGMLVSDKDLITHGGAGEDLNH